ncbi:hypothetical protein ACYJW8_10435 [Frateuria aurantia]
MNPPSPVRWPSSRAIVDQRSGLTTILMMTVSVEAVIVAATLANHHWGWATALFLAFLPPDLWLGRRAYGLGIGLRREGLERPAMPAWSPALREAARLQLDQLQAHTDRDWLTRTEWWQLQRAHR